MSDKAMEMMAELLSRQQQTLERIAEGQERLTSVILDAQGHPMAKFGLDEYAPSTPVEKLIADNVVAPPKERELSEAGASRPIAKLEDIALDEFLAEGKPKTAGIKEHIVFVQRGGKVA